MRGKKSASRRSGEGPVGSRRNIARSIAVLRNQLNGVSIKPNPDPPTTVDRPWNNLVVAFDVTAPGNITVGQVITALRAQALAGTTSIPIEVRLMEVRAWELTGANLGLQIFSCTQPTTSGVSAVKTEHDQPGRNHWACCGMSWPKSHQSEPLGSNQLDAVVLGLSTVAATADIRVHLSLVWRTQEVPVPTALAVIS